MSDNLSFDPPPYPRDTAPIAELFDNLKELIDWTTPQIDWANAEARRLQIAGESSEFIPEFRLPAVQYEFFARQPVSHFYALWQNLRKIRETYDAVVRNYEHAGDWESNPSIYHRIRLVSQAVSVLNLAFINSEQREAKLTAISHKLEREAVKTLFALFRKAKNGADDELEDGEES